MSNLTDIIDKYSTIAVTGMCKNAGKTTVVNHIIGEYRGCYKLGITSIGYDGEDIDEITMLEKPRIMVYPGMLVATCENCLETTSARFKEMYDTGMRTALGNIRVIEIIKQGIVEVSGPSLVSQIEDICMAMKELGGQKVLVDGAAGRLSFAPHLDCTILSVGAALSNDMTHVIRSAGHLVDILGIKKCQEKFPMNLSGTGPYYIFHEKDRMVFLFRGPMVDGDLTNIMKNHKGLRKSAVIKDAAAIFISPGIYKKFRHRKGDICVRNETNLAALTINPMSPYGNWFNKDRFLKNMKARFDLPVINVMDEEV